MGIASGDDDPEEKNGLKRGEDGLKVGQGGSPLALAHDLSLWKKMLWKYVFYHFLQFSGHFSWEKWNMMRHERAHPKEKLRMRWPERRPERPPLQKIVWQKHMSIKTSPKSESLWFFLRLLWNLACFVDNIQILDDFAWQWPIYCW